MPKNQWCPDFLSQYRTEIMGFAILWIVLFHSAIPAPENTVLRLIWYCAINFGGGLGVNLFMILSGFGLLYSHSKRSCCADIHAVKTYFSRRLKRILIPYLLVASIFFAIRCICNKTGILGFAEDVTLLSFLTKGDRTYWYIFAILLLYCLYPLYMYMAERFGHGLTFIAVIAANILFEIIAHTFFPVFYDRFEIIILRNPLFFIGSYLGWIIKEKPSKAKPVLIGITLVAAVCFCAYGFLFLKGATTLRLERYLFIPVSLGIVAVLPLVFNKTLFFNKFLQFCGRNSLGIYLIHIPLYHFAQILSGGNWNPYAVCIGVAVLSMLGAEGISRLTVQKR